MPEEKDDAELTQEAKLSGYRTYLMGAGIIVHQLASAFGIDVPEQLWSHVIDVVLGFGVLYYRFAAKKKGGA